MALTGVVLAAGAGARLGVLGHQYSKATLPIAGRPLIDWVVERLRGAGVERLIVVGHPDDERLREYIHAARLTLVLQAERRGIADAVRCALAEIGAENAYLACACDSIFTGADLRALIARGAADSGHAVVGVLAMSPADTAARSAVRLDGERVVAIVEKPAPGSAPSALVAAPLYWLPRALDAYLRQIGGGPTGERFVTTALSDFIAARGRVLAVRLSGRVEITAADDVARAEALLKNDSHTSPSGGGRLACRLPEESGG